MWTFIPHSTTNMEIMWNKSKTVTGSYRPKAAIRANDFDKNVGSK